MSRKAIPIDEVEAWLKATHPEMAAHAERERQWIWISADLRGEHNKELRESIKGYGFRFKPGNHLLPSGRIAHWAHACDKPMPFRRKPSAQPTKPNEPREDIDPAVAALFGL